MVVLAPLLEGEARRTCRTCPTIGITSPIPERSSFAGKLHRDGGLAFAVKCPACIARELEAVREARDFALIDQWEAREQAGEELPLRTIKASNSGPLLPAAPFRAWVSSLGAQRSATADVRKHVAGRLGVSPRRLYDWLNVMEWVYEAVVDAACTHHGGMTVAELYPDGPATLAPESVPAPAEAPAGTCHSPGCRMPADDGRWCSACADRLARIRADVDAEAARFKARIKRPGARATCCAPDCQRPRLRTARYCPSCAEDGWDEGNLE